MWIIVKILVSVVLTAALIVIGFALGYPIGKHEGFETGGEWALIQAKLAAREAGVIMPVYLEDGLFHVVLRKSPESQRISKQQEAWCEEAKDAVSNIPAAAGGSSESMPEASVSMNTGAEMTTESTEEKSPAI